jgi:hypothetical protein
LPEAVLGGRQVELLGERLAVALAHHERWDVAHVVLPEEAHEGVVHRLVGYAVDEDVGPGLHSGAGRLQLRRVHCHPLPGGVRLVDRRLHDRTISRGCVVRPHDVPDLDEVDPGLDLLAHLLPRGLGLSDL